VPGQPSENKIRPERTAENVPTASSILSGRIIFPARIRPLRGWLISAVPPGHKFPRAKKLDSFQSKIKLTA